MPDEGQAEYAGKVVRVRDRVHPATLSLKEMDEEGQKLVRMATGDEEVSADTLQMCASIITHLTCKLYLIRRAAE